MAIVESRVKDGVLSLGTDPDDIDFSCQVTNARINTSYTDDGDSLETLCGDTIPPGRKLDSRSLAGTFVQDWTAATSITDFVWDHELEEMAFTYTPNVDGPTLTGTLRVEVPARDLRRRRQHPDHLRLRVVHHRRRHPHRGRPAPSRPARPSTS